MNGWTTGDWVVFGLSAVLIPVGLYFVVFAARIDAKQQAKLEAEGQSEGGYRSPLADTNLRTQGLVLIVLGLFGLLRFIAY